MSVSSAASSVRSVVFDGVEQTLEQALDELIRTIRDSLNLLQANLRSLAALEDGEQAVDDEDDYKMAVELEGQTIDLCDRMNGLLREMVAIAGDIRGKAPTPELAKWFKELRASQKETKRFEAQRAKLIAKQAKDAAKEAAKSGTS